MIEMTEQERLNSRVKRKIAVQDAKFNAFMEEMRDFKNETRAQVSEIRHSIDSMNKHVRNLTITAMIGIGAMVITTVYSVMSVLK